MRRFNRLVGDGVCPNNIGNAVKYSPGKEKDYSKFNEKKWQKLLCLSRFWNWNSMKA